MLILWSYFRSSAAYRVRIALNYKQVPYQTKNIHLLKNEQRSEDYLQINPQARVPFMDDNGLRIGQSFAILEYLEEQYPQPSLLPNSIADRAWIRNFAQIIVADIHPLNNSGTLNYLRSNFSASENDIEQWYFNWLKEGFVALETMLAASKNYTEQYCYKDQLTFADVCLIPQLYNARRFNFDLTAYPYLCNVEANLLQHPAIQAAAPASSE